MSCALGLRHGIAEAEAVERVMAVARIVDATAPVVPVAIEWVVERRQVLLDFDADVRAPVDDAELGDPPGHRDLGGAQQCKLLRLVSGHGDL